MTRTNFLPLDVEQGLIVGQFRRAYRVTYDVEDGRVLSNLLLATVGGVGVKPKIETITDDPVVAPVQPAKRKMCYAGGSKNKCY